MINPVKRILGDKWTKNATGRSNKNMSWTKCEKCGGRIYEHRPNSHICGDENESD